MMKIIGQRVINNSENNDKIALTNAEILKFENRKSLNMCKPHEKKRQLLVIA